MKEKLGEGEWISVDTEDEMVVNFYYPQIFEAEYLRSCVRLEIGPLAEWMPSHETTVTPFATEKYPDVFSQKETSVLTVDVERTFWEKLTILHKIANFPEGKTLPARYARHLYDVYNLGNSWVKESAFKRKELLEKDVAFKQKFYYAKGAHYETATLSSIELLPRKTVLNALQEDYQAMKNMIYGNIPEFKDIYEVFKDDIGVQKSLLRESSAEKALFEAKYVLRNDKLEEKDISFQCSYKAPYSLNAIELNFNFKKNQYIPYRICAIVGKNGTGKTQFLSQLASSLSGLNESNNNIIFKGRRPPIDRVMSISYSVFDGFNKVRGDDSVYSYVYCGLQTENGILSQDQIQQNFKMAYSQIINRGRFNDWENIIREVLESEHQDILKKIEKDDFSSINWSSGQHILISTMTELVCNIEKESLILFDEPEIHLHPNAIANVMRMFSKLLEEYDSYAIFATHSPIILQELPSTNIQIFEKIDNTFLVRNPLIECFGDNISNIISDIFDVTEIESYHKQVLKKLSDQIPEEEVYKLFNEHLSIDAKIYLKTLYRGNHND